MARDCNGAGDGFSRANYDLRGASIVSVSAWVRIDAYGAASRRLFAHSNGASDDKVFVCELVGPVAGAAAGSVAVYFTTSAAAQYWIDSFPQPSLGVWHHWVWVANRATPSNVVYIDGVAQTMTTVLHNAAAYGDFDNRTLWVMNQNAGAYVDGAIAEMCEYRNTYALTAKDAVALAAGGSPPEVRGDQMIDYWPFDGADSPEPNYGLGHNQPLAIAGAPAYTRPPGVRSMKVGVI